MYKLLILVFTILICFGCDDDQFEAKDIPDDLEIDLNQDGIVDFQIIYQKLSASAPVDPDPGPYELIRGKLVSQNGNQILKKEEAASILFLNDINLIQTNLNPPLFWEVNADVNSSIIVGIIQNFDRKTWPEEWNIKNDEIKDSYLVGFKLFSNNNVSSLGFIELSIDNQTGQIEILNIKFI